MGRMMVTQPSREGPVMVCLKRPVDAPAQGGVLVEVEEGLAPIQLAAAAVAVAAVAVEPDMVGSRAKPSSISYSTAVTDYHALAVEEAIPPHTSIHISTHTSMTEWALVDSLAKGSNSTCPYPVASRVGVHDHSPESRQLGKMASASEFLASRELRVGTTS